ncbi:LysR family transcriptional regulator [uncultured Aliiroseovarius sp.]|uniref:LysR family transcriptional regulator n=1 Tax=uncultured Aliiroseovarius sp. TaxID=1658783 RepID=UPI002594E7C0|nr:LysR family transcriptional regulator [uncultured Aliiroseovarius sp.]
MTLDQLRIFIAVADREHITQAAAHLNLTQSAVSAAIAALEERHAIQLFDRVGRRIVLTDAGRLFLDEARAVVARAEQAARLLGDLAGLKRGILRLAASQTVANYWLPSVMQRFGAAYPGFRQELVTGNTEDVARMVHAATVDLGFVEGQIEDSTLAIQSVPGDELALVVAPDHTWAQKPPAGPKALISSPWVLRESGSGTRAACMAALSRHGLGAEDVEVRLEMPSNEAVRAAVESGAGVTILSTLVVGPSVDAGRLVRVPFDLPPRQFHVLRHKKRHASLAEQKFLELA